MYAVPSLLSTCAADTSTLDERDKAKFEDLHRSIRACDDVLNSVEVNLSKFHDDLGTVSAEIETLQARSTALSVRLENRKLVEKGLGPIVEEITLSPAVVRKISEGAIDEAWVRALAEVEKRSKALDMKSKEQRNIKGINDLRPLLTHLVNKALERIRDFLVAQIKALRSPNINAQIIQQQHFLRCKDLYTFLSRHHETLAEEIGQAYMNTMRWYFLDQFTRYAKALEKLKVHVLDKHDVLGHDDGSRKTNLLSGSKTAAPPHDAFSLGRRIDLLKTSNQTALASYLAEEDKSYHYLEFPFRSFNLALVDNASAEYSFLTSFFSPSLPLSTISRNFNYIFEPTFNLGRTLTRSLVGETVDCLGLLMCVRLNQHFAFELQRRKVPAVDGYINGTNMLLWPRFQVIMDLHCESIRKAASALSSQAPSSKAEQAKQSAAPHFLTQRFGQFLQGIVALSAEAGDDEPVSTSLGRLRSEMEAFLTKLSKSIGEARKRERFLYNNYSLILTILGDVDGKLAMEQKEHFEALKMAFSGGS
jgi:vacuolar protein sorting-associated protein 52